MSRHLPQVVLDIAYDVRKNVIHWTKDNIAVDQFDMMGACAIASYTLWRACQKIGIKNAKFITTEDSFGSGHCWVEIDDYIVDLTAIQFDPTLDSVFVCKICDKDKYDFYMMPKKFVNGAGVREVNRSWNERQTPKMYRNKIYRYLKK